MVFRYANAFYQSLNHYCLSRSYELGKSKFRNNNAAFCREVDAALEPLVLGIKANIVDVPELQSKMEPEESEPQFYLCLGLNVARHETCLFDVLCEQASE